GGHRVLVTGGAGFIGASLCVALAERHRDWQIVASDNLFRRGSELNLPRLRATGVVFVHGDVRHSDDLERAGRFDALVECSAEPSVMAAVEGASRFVVGTNLLGAHLCLELAARHRAQVIFLSTSRVYPIAGLNALAFNETESRFSLLDEQSVAGASREGISASFALHGPRTLYGSTKLGAELLVAEYGAMHGLSTTINRCGVIAGPWQMGKVDQGVFTHWILSAYLGRRLRYIGFGGTGKQVRDLLHIDDLVDLVELQLGDPVGWAGTTHNVGGGRAISLSLREATALCEELIGKPLTVAESNDDRPGDVRIYLSDCRKLYAHTTWRPTRDARRILGDTLAWIRRHEDLVVAALD